MPNFIFSGSTSPATGAVAMWNMKQLFLAAGYTVPSSSDGTTFQAGDIHTTSTTLSNVDAWFIVRQPAAAAVNPDYGGVQREFAFQRGTNNLYWRAAYSYSSSFTGSADATTIPTALDQKRIIGTEFPAFSYNTTFLDADGSYVLHHCVDTEAPLDRKSVV